MIIDYINQTLSFHPEMRALGTVIAFVFVAIAATVISVRYAHTRFMESLQKSIDKEVQTISDHVEKTLNIKLPNGNGDHLGSGKR